MNIVSDERDAILYEWQRKFIEGPKLFTALSEVPRGAALRSVNGHIYAIDVESGQHFITYGFRRRSPDAYDCEAYS